MFNVRSCKVVIFTFRQHSGGSVAEWLALGTQVQKARVPIVAATLSGNSLRQTVHTHCASVHQGAKLAAALLRVAGVTAGLAENNGSLPPSLWLTSPARWLPRTGISCGTLRSVIEYGLGLLFLDNTQTVYSWWDICRVLLFFVLKWMNEIYRILLVRWLLGLPFVISGKWPQILSSHLQRACLCGY